YYDPTPAFSPAALATFGVTVDTVAPVVLSATSTGTLLSPNGDGILDAVAVRLVASGADRWTFTGAPIGGAPIVSAGGPGGTAAVTWGGRSSAGTMVPDGLYKLVLTAIDAAGNRAARAWTVRVDRTPARLRPSAAPGLFSPNGDGLVDTTLLAWTATEPITGNARVYLGTTLIRSWTVTAAGSGVIGWNGTDSAGRGVADGRYTFRVAGRDAAGNLTVAAASVAVDRTLSAVRWNRPAFYPQDGDGLVPTAAIAYSMKRSAFVSIGIYSGASLIRSVLVERALGAGSHGWTWDGRNANGVFVARGTYTARVTARTAIGTSLIVRPIVADAFRTVLSATTLRPGQTLTVTLTTTEGLRAAPSVTFTQPGRSAVTRTATSLGSGRYRVSFVIASGSSGPATLRMSGRDSAGGLNTSSGSVTIR
ncbi:MAG: FlgD immunoglobulin-like domain containing protein, partial [Candidatus Limnocylindrales bacterium]